LEKLISMADESIDLVIHRGEVVTAGGVRKLAIGVKNGKIVSLTSEGDPPAARQIIDAAGKHVLPGLVDPENHAGTHRPLKEVKRGPRRPAGLPPGE
jgi:dihydroorotase-like cyclic amidohydrolase